MSSDPIQTVDLLIVGGGPAGLAAAVAAWDKGCRSVLILERDDRLGGILPQCIHNGFGLHRYHEELTGPEYAQKDIQAVLERQIPYQCGTMVLEITPDRRVTAVSPRNGLQQFSAGAIILAMGCRERPRGALGIPGTRCAGILTAGTAQRLINLEGFLPGTTAVILGSGDIGLIMARRLTFEGVRVLACVEIMPYSSGLTRNVVQCLQDYDIPLLLNHTIVDIHGGERLEGVTVAQVDPTTRRPVQGSEQYLACDTLLLSVGLIPENELSRQAGVALDDITQGARVDQDLATSVPGIFACGNVLHVHDLVDDVSAEAAKAGEAAAAWLRGRDKFAGAEKGEARSQAEQTMGQTRPATADAIPVVDGRGVRGVVPQILRRPENASRLADSADHAVRLSFRPDAVYRKATVCVAADGMTIARFPKAVLAPGEMASVSFDPGRLPAGPVGSISVSVEVKADHE
jgi:NADPH-dependent 2,4-dienoyl-CoA reductase/sulfur reductase-like enzyme